MLKEDTGKHVTILILIDGFLQYEYSVQNTCICRCHNPYFNRWFSAIKNINTYNLTRKTVTILILIDGFLQYGGRRY